MVVYCACPNTLALLFIVSVDFLRVLIEAKHHYETCSFLEQCHNDPSKAQYQREMITHGVLSFTAWRLSGTISYGTELITK